MEWSFEDLEGIPAGAVICLSVGEVKQYVPAKTHRFKVDCYLPSQLVGMKFEVLVPIAVGSAHVKNNAAAQQVALAPCLAPRAGRAPSLTFTVAGDDKEAKGSSMQQTLTELLRCGTSSGASRGATQRCRSGQAPPAASPSSDGALAADQGSRAAARRPKSGRELSCITPASGRSTASTGNPLVDLALSRMRGLAEADSEVDRLRKLQHHGSLGAGQRGASITDGQRSREASRARLSSRSASRSRAEQRRRPGVAGAPALCDDAGATFAKLLDASALRTSSEAAAAQVHTALRSEAQAAASPAPAQREMTMSPQRSSAERTSPQRSSAERTTPLAQAAADLVTALESALLPDDQPTRSAATLAESRSRPSLGKRASAEGKAAPPSLESASTAGGSSGSRGTPEPLPSPAALDVEDVRARAREQLRRLSTESLLEVDALKSRACGVLLSIANASKHAADDDQRKQRPPWSAPQIAITESPQRRRSGETMLPSNSAPATMAGAQQTSLPRLSLGAASPPSAGRPRLTPTQGRSRHSGVAASKGSPEADLSRARSLPRVGRQRSNSCSEGGSRQRPRSVPRLQLEKIAEFEERQKLQKLQAKVSKVQHRLPGLSMEPAKDMSSVETQLQRLLRSSHGSQVDF